jgi:hypothetical protein
VNPLACAGCATPLRPQATVCPVCGAPVGRGLATWRSASAWVTAVAWPGGTRVVKVLKNADDERGRTRIHREATVLASISSRVPPELVPEVVAAGPGVVVTRLAAGVTAQHILRRPTVDLDDLLSTAGHAVQALQAVDTACIPPLPPPPRGAFDPPSVVGSLFPGWALDAALAATRQPPPRSVLVHGDYVPTNWIWNGRRLCVVDFEEVMTNGSPEYDSALAWARLRLMGAGLQQPLGRRLSAVVLRPPWPVAGVASRANALVIVAMYDWLRIKSIRRPLRDLRLAALRSAVRQAVRELAS